MVARVDAAAYVESPGVVKRRHAMRSDLFSDPDISVHFDRHGARPSVESPSAETSSLRRTSLIVQFLFVRLPPSGPCDNHGAVR